MTETAVDIKRGADFKIEKNEFCAKLSQKERLALGLAEEIHKNDFRKTTGEPYVNHCIAVAELLIEWGCDEDTVIAGILHDTVEDHPDAINLELIEDMFSPRVAHSVDGVSKFKSPTGKDNDFETLKKLARKARVELRVSMIKFADRLHNMKTMEDGPLGKGFSKEKKMAKAKETLTMYVPLAESLGLWQIKNSLADISFFYMDPERYQRVKEAIDSDPRLDPEFIRNTKEEIQSTLNEAGVKAEVRHQIGGYWELAEKQRMSAMRSDSLPKEFSDITDVISFRVVLGDNNDLGECYRAMGELRANFGDKLCTNGGGDDTLVKPEMNGYSAIHEKYRFGAGLVEIAITTEEKEEFNMRGVLTVDIEEIKNNPEKYQRIMIFTPKEELVIMKPGATGIDLAYKLNPLLGLRATKMLVNGKEMELGDVIPNAALVEIITDPHRNMPDKKWLKVCNEETREILEQQMKVLIHDMEVEKGEVLLIDKVLRERGVLNLEDLKNDVVDKLLFELGCWNGVETLYYKLANGLELELVAKKLDDAGVVKGVYTSVLVRGKNSIGVSEKVARIIGENGGDARSKVEKVEDDETFYIRVLLIAGESEKRVIEEMLKESFDDCEVV
jgi:GTP pyrophosphokinase